MNSLPGQAQTEKAAPAAPAKLTATLAASPYPTARPASPRQLFPGLFEAVQRGHVFPDNKTFVDAAPRQRPATMLAAWQRENTQPGFQLKAFVTARFDLPTDGAVPFRSNVAAGLRHHLDTLWAVLARQRGNGELLGYRPALEAKYRYWMRGAEPLKPGTAAHRVVRLPNGALLNRYWDDSDQPREESYAEDVAAAQQSPQPPAQFCRNVRAAAASGWGFSSRWFRAGVLLRLLNRYEPK